jgi:hypothetical protein
MLIRMRFFAGGWQGGPGYETLVTGSPWAHTVLWWMTAAKARMEATMIDGKRWLVLALALMMTGCTDLLSVHPLSLPGDLAFEATLIGEWVNVDEDGTATAMIRASTAQARVYDILWIPPEADEEALRLQGRLVRIGDRLVFDLVKAERPEMGVAGHFFMLVDKQGNELKLHWLDSEWLRERVVRSEKLAFVVVDGKPVITSATPVVLEFMRTYGLDAKAISGTITFTRAKAR